MTNKKRPKRPPRPKVLGRWFEVPRVRGAVGLVTRWRSPIALGYFFLAPSNASAFSVSELRQLTPKDAVFVVRFGGRPLTEGEFPLVPDVAEADVSRWPVPEFQMKADLIPALVFVRRYDDRLEFTGERTVSRRPRGMPEDTLYSAGSIEEMLKAARARSVGRGRRRAH